MLPGHMNIDNRAHLGGLVGGAVVVLGVKPNVARGVQRPKAKVG